MDLEQLEKKKSESLSNGTKEENFVKGEIKTDQVLDQEEPAEIDSMDEADAGTHSAPKRVHTFYFVKFRPYELTKRMQCKIKQHKLETQRRRKEVLQCKKELTCIKSKRCSILDDLNNSILHVNMKNNWDCYWNSEFVEHMRDILNEESRKNGTTDHPSKEYEFFDLIKEKQRIRSDSLKSGEEKRIMSLKHRIQNQRLTSKEKTILLKLIKELETTRDKAIDAAAEASLEAKKRHSIRFEFSWRRQRQSIEKYIQFHENYAEQLNQQLLESSQEIPHLHKHLEVVDKKIKKLEQKINYSNLRMDKAHAVILKSENLLDKMSTEKKTKKKRIVYFKSVCKNAGYLQKCELLDDADTLAKQNDLSALANLSNSELEKFFMQWSNNKDFKEDYKSRVIPSLENRGLSRDGRVANAAYMDKL